MHNLSKRSIYLLLLVAGFAITSGFTVINDPTSDPEPKVEAAEAEALGVWISNNGNEKFEIYRKEDKFYGRIVWTNHEERLGYELTDDNNPDPELKGKPVIGLEILKDFQYRGNGVYNHGKVYDPGSGNTYKCKIKVDGNTAKVRGYILLPLLGRTETAHRVLD